MTEPTEQELLGFIESASPGSLIELSELQFCIRSFTGVIHIIKTPDDSFTAAFEPLPFGASNVLSS